MYGENQLQTRIYGRNRQIFIRRTHVFGNKNNPYHSASLTSTFSLGVWQLSLAIITTHLLASAQGLLRCSQLSHAIVTIHLSRPRVRQKLFDIPGSLPCPYPLKR